MNKTLATIIGITVLEAIIAVIGYIKQIQLIVVIPIFLLLVILQIVLLIQNQRQSVGKSIIESLSQIKNDITGTLREREARIYPGNSLPNLRIIDLVINQIKLKGYIEIIVQNMGMSIKKDEILEVHQVFPGMSKRFLILIGDKNITSDKNLYYLRIYPPESKMTDRIDERDFAETWFNYIFPILGNFSGYISEKTEGYTQIGREFESECYYLSKYKYIKTNAQNKLDKMRIYFE